MQTIVIAVLIIIAGLISAILVCAMSLINRARAATTTLRRIEETLLAMNRVRAIDSAVKSAETVKEPQTGAAGTNGYLTLRELKTMSGGGGKRTNDSRLSTGRKPPRTHAPARATGPQSVPGRESPPVEQPAEVAAQGVTDAVVQVEHLAQPIPIFAKQDSGFDAADVTPTQEMFAEPRDEERLESSIEMSWPGLHQQILNLELQKDTDDVLAHESLSVAAAVAHAAPAATTLESAAGNVPAQAVRAEQPAPTSNDLDESRRKKKEQELMMIISSRRRRARAGR